MGSTDLEEREDAAKAAVIKFKKKTTDNLKNISADDLVRNGGINPFLIKALGIDDFESLARFCVYQRAGRSVVTSFGSTIEKVVRDISGGEKGDWWDVVVDIKGSHYYLSVKSGPRDMDKDQVEHFAGRARKLLKKEPNSRPMIAMSYGRAPLGVIKPCLSNEGLSPSRHTLTGRGLYALITGKKQYYRRLLRLAGDAAEVDGARESFTDLVESKIEEVSREFRKKYKDVDELLLATF